MTDNDAAISGVIMDARGAVTRALQLVELNLSATSSVEQTGLRVMLIEARSALQSASLFLTKPKDRPEAAGAGPPVLDILAAVDHPPSHRLPNSYSAPWLTHWPRPGATAPRSSRPRPTGTTPTRS